MNLISNPRTLLEISSNTSTLLDSTCLLNKSCPSSKFVTTNCISPSSNRRPSLTKTYSDASTMHCPDSSLFISARQMKEKLGETPTSSMFPIIDCRSQMDFGAERVRSAHNVNCRAKLIARKLISKRLEEVEPGLLVPFQHSEFIILYDQSIEHLCEEKMSSLPIHLVVQAAKRSQKTVYIVQGGFDAIKKECPYLIECAIPMSNSNDQLPPIPATPEPIDKENLLMSQVMPRLFVGNALDAHNAQRLAEYGITHVINATPDLAFCDARKCKILRVSVRDLPSENISHYFEDVNNFIETALSDESSKVLVHCSAGISRSPTLVLAYMIKKEHITVNEALTKMRKYRSIVDPNLGFIFQLRNWEKSCLSKTESVVDGNRSFNNGPIAFSTVRPHSTTSRYCSSTSTSKKETNACADAPIPVN